MRLVYPKGKAIARVMGELPSPVAMLKTIELLEVQDCIDA
ncbi:hypothetical protein TFLX_01375 [Thermoflexales bacterium]|nr:hypothetical protein TFLX_01375 [Thermoflexales bacterium]